VPLYTELMGKECSASAEEILIINPSLRAFSPGKTACVKRVIAVMFSAICDRESCKAPTAMGASRAMPALFTKTLTAGFVARTCATLA